MKTLIVYYSFTQNNSILAKYLQGKLGCDMLRIEEVKKRTGLTILLDLLFNRSPKIRGFGLSLSRYDHFILIAPVWAGKIASPLKTFLLQAGHAIHNYSFITVCGGQKGQREKIANQLEELLHIKPEMVTELWVNDLLPEEKKNTIKYASGYRIEQKDLAAFEEKIKWFLTSTEVSSPVL